MKASLLNGGEREFYDKEGCKTKRTKGGGCCNGFVAIDIRTDSGPDGWMETALVAHRLATGERRQCTERGKALVSGTSAGSQFKELKIKQPGQMSLTGEELRKAHQNKAKLERTLGSSRLMGMLPGVASANCRQQGRSRGRQDHLKALDGKPENVLVNKSKT